MLLYDREPRYALFGAVNKRSPGEEPQASQFISAHHSVAGAQNRAGFGNVRGDSLRWYAVVDRESGDVVLRGDL
jgi:hypothetical protein